MKTISKRTHLLAALSIVVGLLLAACLLVLHSPKTKSVTAEENANKGLTYYYDELSNSELAQRFYNVMTDMNVNGYFVDGRKDYDLSSALSQAELYDYLVNGSPKIPVALGAARDAFFMDHPELFYIDVHKLVLSAYGDGTNFTAYLGAGTADNYFTDYTVNSKEQAEAAIEAFDAAVDGLVAEATAASRDVVEQIKFVNKKIAEKIDYSNGAYEDKHNGLVYNGFVNTAYALVDGEALCGGYSTAFKVIMDKLGIPCALIAGSAYSGIGAIDSVTGEALEAGYGAHMWNAVEVDGLWYGVDVTWNDTCNNLDKYMLVGSEFLSTSHFADNVISSSGFELQYPAIRALDYGVNVDKSGFMFKDSGEINGVEFGYIASEDENSDTHNLSLGIAYEGKNFIELNESGKYLAKRYCLDGSGEWTAWYCVYTLHDFYIQNSNFTEADTEAYLKSTVANEYTIEILPYNTAQIQFAIFDREPVGDGMAMFTYSDEEIAGHIISTSVPYTNECYGKFLPAPHISNMEPLLSSVIKKFDPIDITLTYSEQLVYADTVDKTVGVKIYGTSPDLGDYAVAKNVVWNEDENSLSFTLYPSQQYSHNCELYYMVPTNLIGKNSGKVPDAATISFERKRVVCPRVFNDGRLYILAYGQPQFVSASDESLTSFKDENGQPIVGDQRSQLMLVVNEPTQAESDDMKQAAMDEYGLDDDDIYASSTYQIDLQMCGLVQHVPDGSYMQIGLGFPAGYGPNDAGVTFTVYHYKRDASGNITEVETVPCVITQYGIIATVKSFSPFMICAVNSDKVQTSTKNILASVDGVGGSVDKSDIVCLDDESITYTITSDDGYSLYKVLVNGVDRTSDVTANGELALDFAELDANNTVVISFIADSAIAADREKNMTRVQLPTIVATSDDMIVAYVKDTPAPDTSIAPAGKKSHTGLIVGIVVAVVVVLAACGVAAFFILRKRANAEASAKSTSTAKTSQSKSASTKTTTNKSQSTTAKTSTSKSQSSSAKPRSDRNKK